MAEAATSSERSGRGHKQRTQWQRRHRAWRGWRVLPLERRAPESTTPLAPTPVDARPRPIPVRLSASSGEARQTTRAPAPRPASWQICAALRACADPSRARESKMTKMGPQSTSTLKRERSRCRSAELVRPLVTTFTSASAVCAGKAQANTLSQYHLRRAQLAVAQPAAYRSGSAGADASPIARPASSSGTPERPIPQR